VMMHDPDLGVVRARAFGIYDFHVIDPKLFLKEVAGTDAHFTLEEFSDTMRSRIVSVFSEALAKAKIPVLEVAARYSEVGTALLPIINAVIGTKYGLEMTSFILENVSVPPEVEQAIDKRSSMTAIGNLNDYVKFQMGQGMAQGGAGSTPAEMAMGFAIAQQMIQQPGGIIGSQPSAPTQAGGGASPELLTPAEAAKVLSVSEEDVMASVTSGELKAKKIGNAYRITRQALDEFLKA
jgi:excisionase family DNA binding protein